MLIGCDGRLVLAEQEQDYRDREKGAEFCSEEHAGSAVHPEEVIEVHACSAAEHDGGRIAHASGGTLKVR